MNLFRLLLAISVLIAHSESLFGLHLIGGRLAVKVFFMISGFYMAMVLQEKYNGPKDYALFLSNRFLRLYPIYWVVLLCTIALGLGSGLLRGHYGPLQQYVDYPQNLNVYNWIYFVFTNVFIVGQDVGYFLQFGTNAALQFTTDFRGEFPRVYNYFLIAPAWSISLEMLFYIIAPFLVKLKTRVLWLLIACSILLKFMIIFPFNLRFDPWTYRFLLFEISFFLLGIIAYRMYTVVKEKRPTQPTNYLVLAVVLTFTLLHRYLPGGDAKDIMYITTCFFSIPYIFLSTHNNKADRYIGEYSYTLYISHFLMLAIVHYFSKRWLLPPTLTAELTLLSGIIFSYFLITFISKKIDRYRQRRVAKNRAKIRTLQTNNMVV